MNIPGFGENRKTEMIILKTALMVFFKFIVCPPYINLVNLTKKEKHYFFFLQISLTPTFRILLYWLVVGFKANCLIRDLGIWEKCSPWEFF